MLLGEHVIWLSRKREAVFWQRDNKASRNSEIVRGKKRPCLVDRCVKEVAEWQHCKNYLMLLLAVMG